MPPQKLHSVALLCLFFPLLLEAQGPRIGLALSGGGAKGFAHVGVLKVLDEAGVRIDAVAGTSFGSVVGALYALGYSGAAIESLLTAQDWDALILDRRERTLLPMIRKWGENRYSLSLPMSRGSIQLPGGIVEGENMGILLSRLTIPVHSAPEFSTLPIPFAAVATDIATGEAVVFERGDLGDAIRASVSLPFAFTPISIGGRLLVDGGLVRNFPAEDVRRMNVDFVIGVDIGSPQLRQEEISSFLQIISQALFFADEADRRIQRALCDILLLPDIDGFSLLDFERTRELVKRGEDAARAFRPQLDSLARLQGAAPRRTRLDVPPRLRIDSIEVEGANKLTQRTITAELGLPLRTPIPPEEIDRAVDRIAALGTYRSINYRIRRGPEGDTLLIRPREQYGAIFHAGLRYDSFDQASVLFNGTWNDVWGELSTGTVDLRLGEQKTLEGAIASPLWFSAGLGGRLALLLREHTIPTASLGPAREEITVRSAALTLSIGTFYARSFLLSAGARAEYAGAWPVLTETDSTRVDRFIAHAFLAAFDNTDRPHLPRSGFTGFGGTDGAFAPLSSHGGFVRWFGWLRGAFQLTNRFFVSAEVFSGRGHGDGLPPHYLFRLGGLRTPTFLPYERFVRMSLLGFQQQELVGRRAFVAHAALHLEPAADIVISLRCSAGLADNDPVFRLKGKRFAGGVGLTGTLLTPVGPMELSVMSGSEHRVLTFVSLGVEF